MKNSNMNTEMLVPLLWSCLKTSSVQPRTEGPCIKGSLEVGSWTREQVVCNWPFQESQLFSEQFNLTVTWIFKWDIPCGELDFIHALQIKLLVCELILLHFYWRCHGWSRPLWIKLPYCTMVDCTTADTVALMRHLGCISVLYSALVI